MNFKALIKPCFFLIVVTAEAFCSNQPFSENDEKSTLVYLKNFLKEAYDAAQKSIKDPSEKSKFADIIIKNFSLSDMASPILGPYRLKLSPEQRKEFEKKLTNYFLKTYGTTEKISLFASTEMNDDNINKRPRITQKNNRMVYIATFRTKTGNVEAKFTLLKKGESLFKIADIHIERISLVIGTRDQIATLHTNQTVKPEVFLEKFEKFIKN